MQIEFNKRNFAYAEFEDRYGCKCSIQKSSLAEEDCIWLGLNDADPKIMSTDATRMGLRERTFDERDNGWVKYEIPKEVLLNTRMHLTQEMAAELIVHLQQFVDTGELFEAKTERDEAIELLKTYNRWRRGEGTQPDPIETGKAIDKLTL
jgi:hypothetical protein